MKRTLTLILAVVMALGLTAGAVLAQSQGPPDHAGPPDRTGPPFGELVASGDHGPPSPGFADDENIVDTLTLSEGDWKVTATGAVQVADSALAPNCGIRLDEGDEQTMLGKQNFADGGFVGRAGFAVVGAAAIDGDALVHLVCYGTGNNAPFEHNLVAIRGR